MSTQDDMPEGYLPGEDTTQRGIEPEQKKTYSIYYKMVRYGTCEVEASSEEEARQKWTDGDYDQDSDELDNDSESEIVEISEESV